MPQRELKILFAVLSCWAIRQWITASVTIGSPASGFGEGNFKESYPLTMSQAFAVIPIAGDIDPGRGESAHISYFDANSASGVISANTSGSTSIWLVILGS